MELCLFGVDLVDDFLIRLYNKLVGDVLEDDYLVVSFVVLFLLPPLLLALLY